MEASKKKPSSMGVRVIKQQGDMEPYSVFYDDRKPIEKSDKSEQLHIEEQVNASDWIVHPIDMHGLKALVSNSTILPQCIRAYKNNIAGFGIGVRYACDCDEETPEMKAEWTKLEGILELLNMECMAKEIFEKIITARETYGIAYTEVIRDTKGDVVQLEYIKDTPSIDMTCPLQPYIEVEFYHKGEAVKRKKKFRKFRQTVGGKTVYFKEFGDPRIMNKKDGKYWKEGEEPIPNDDRANEILDFPLGDAPYGEVRWIGQVLTIDGNRRAEILNNNYFRKGRHTPLMILIKGGTLSDESYDKLQSYVNDIEGESGQHSFLVLETDTLESGTAMDEDKQPNVEVKDLASILQKDELFQEYQENGRKKTQSAFLLPDLYVGYTKDFNRSTSQACIEVTEKQVFQPERESLGWIINKRLLNGYRFRHVEAYLMEPDVTDPDDVQKILNVTERAGGLTPNVAKELTYKTLGLDNEEPYTGEWGDIPLAYQKALTQAQQNSLLQQTPVNTKTDEEPAVGQNTKPQTKAKAVTDDEMSQLDDQIQKAESIGENTEVIEVLKSIRKALSDYGADGGANV